MAAVRNLRRNKKHKNYICALVAVNKTGKALGSVTEHGLQTVHNQIQQNLGYLNLPQCVEQCSLKFHNMNRWCQTCSTWRIELENYILQGRRRFRVRWSKMKSWTWPMNSLNIAEVFSVDLNARNLKDLSTALPIWERCSVFQRQIVPAADHLKNSRNQLLHEYNAKMKIPNAKKIEIFQKIRNVITHPDIQPLIPNHNDLIQTIGHLEQGELFRYETDIMDALRDIGMQNADIYARLDRNALGLQEIHTKLEKISLAVQKLIVISIMTIFVLCVLSLCGFFWYLNTPARVLLKDTGIRKDKHTSELLKPPYTLVSTEGGGYNSTELGLLTEAVMSVVVKEYVAMTEAGEDGDQLDATMSFLTTQIQPEDAESSQAPEIPVIQKRQSEGAEAESSHEPEIRVIQIRKRKDADSSHESVILVIQIRKQKDAESSHESVILVIQIRQPENAVSSHEPVIRVIQIRHLKDAESSNASEIPVIQIRSEVPRKPTFSASSPSHDGCMICARIQKLKK